MRVHLHLPPAWHHEPSSQPPLLCAQHLAPFCEELVFGPGYYLSQLVLFGVIAGTVGVFEGIHGRHPVKPQAVFADFFSELVIPGETAGTVEGNAGTLGEIFGFLGETVGILGRHLVKH